MLKISSAPHMASPVSTKNLMKDVVIALMPAVLAALLIFGFNAFQVLLTSVAACVACEYLICRYFLKIPPTTGDFSAVITGILLGFNLPSGIPLWMILIGAFFAIGITKMAYGGLGKNFMNPALAGRAFLMFSWPAAMSTWVVPGRQNLLWRCSTMIPPISLQVLLTEPGSMPGREESLPCILGEIPDCLEKKLAGL